MQASTSTCRLIMALLITTLASLGLSAQAQIVVPGANGSDGVLNVASNEVVIDLFLANTTQWDANPAVAGNGVYDSNKWAVVFKYASVNIAAGATVRFKNHPSRAPVVWLVSGDVTIDGTLDLNGQIYQTPPALAEPGPGGFRGGSGKYATGADGAPGLGPSGGARHNGGSYGTNGDAGRGPYGNPSLVPLIGGSGGGGDGNSQPSGGGGGGALLLACQGTVSIAGTLRANGGSGRNTGYNTYYQSGGGSGGGIRLVASTLEGDGIVHALAGGGYRSGGLGRIRIERVVNNNTLVVSPEPSVVALTAGAQALIWPPADAPTVRVVSIGGEAAPGDPRAEFGTQGADVVLGQTNSVPVIIETERVEQASVLKVRMAPRLHGDVTEVEAAVDSVVSTDPLVVRWRADVPVQNGYSAIQVRVIRP